MGALNLLVLGIAVGLAIRSEFAASLAATGRGEAARLTAPVVRAGQRARRKVEAARKA